VHKVIKNFCHISSDKKLHSKEVSGGIPPPPICNTRVNYGRCNSFLALNAMFSSNKFNVNISNICGGVVNVRRAADEYAERKALWCSG